MLPNNYQSLSSANSSTTNGTAILCTQVVNLSAQAVSTGTPTGSVKLQASNDPLTGPTPYAPSNWTDITSATASISAAGAVLIGKIDISYQWVRAVFTSTGAGVQTVALVADVSGSLNSKYFLLGDEADVHKYYVWFNINSAGVDPLISGRTGVPITGATNASASTLGTAVASAVAALNSTNSFATSGTTTVTITNKVAGPFTPMTDGTAATGFTFAVTAGGGSTVVNFKTNGF